MIGYGLTLALRMTGLGWYVAISILLGVWGGLWLDGLLGRSPVFTILGFVLGLVIAVYGAYRMFAPFLSSVYHSNNDNLTDEPESLSVTDRQN